MSNKLLLTFCKVLTVAKLFVIISIISICFLFLTNRYLLTEEIYYQTLGEQLSTNQIKDMLLMKGKFEAIGYLFITFISLLEYIIIALTIYTGTIIFGLKVKYKSVFKIVILAEFIFLIPLVLKFIWFYFIQSNYTLEDLQFFYPLSLLNIFSTGEVSQLWVYPLQLLNVFEVGYWLLLALGIQRLIKSDFDRSLRLVLSSYLPAMLLWVVFVMFLTVTFNPAMS